MADELARFSSGRAEAHSVDDVVKPRFEQPQEVFAGRALAPRRLGEVAPKLPLEQAIGATQLLLFAQLLAIIRQSHA